jgi:hypothetical protein
MEVVDPQIKRKTLCKFKCKDLFLILFTIIIFIPFGAYSIYFSRLIQCNNKFDIPQVILAFGIVSLTSSLFYLTCLVSRLSSICSTRTGMYWATFFTLLNTLFWISWIIMASLIFFTGECFHTLIYKDFTCVIVIYVLAYLHLFLPYFTKGGRYLFTCCCTKLANSNNTNDANGTVHNDNFIFFCLFSDFTPDTQAYSNDGCDCDFNYDCNYDCGNDCGNDCDCDCDGFGADDCGDIY